MKRIFLLSLIFFGLIVFTARVGNAQTERETGLHIGNIIPDITLNDLDGNPRSISELRGNIVFVDFWASWCRPCRRENPVVVEAYKMYSNKNYKDADGFKIFSISFDSKKEDWIKAIEDDGMEWEEQVSDLKGWRSAAAKKYNVRAIPMNYLIDQNGVIINKNLRGHQLEETLKNLVKE